MKSESSILKILADRASSNPYTLAFRFLVDGESEEFILSNSDLYRKVRILASYLISKYTTGERALLLYPTGLEFIVAYFACLYAGIVAVPIYPPHPARPERNFPFVQVICKDSNASLVLMSAALRKVFEEKKISFSKNNSPDLLATDDILASGDDSTFQQARLSEIAFLQYTSGSTGSPKGVMVTHQNLIHNLDYIRQNFGLSDQSSAVFWLPNYHDMGLIGGLLQAVYSGYPLTIIPQLAFLQKPVRWLQAIAKYKADTSGAPNFAYDLCVNKISVEDRDTLDLSNWKVAFNGAEQVHENTLKRFADYFGPSGFDPQSFLPCYGMAEATLMITGGPHHQPIKTSTLKQSIDLDKDYSRSFIGCGIVDTETEVRIIDKDNLTNCEEGNEGEIWIKGPGVAKGYWNKQEESNYTFNAFIKDSEEGPFLRTGDLGFIRNKTLFVTGRLKELIIISGVNYYPNDIEKTVETAHELIGIQSCAAFSVERNELEELVILFELSPRYLDHANVITQSIKSAIVTQHDLKTSVVEPVRLGSIPKTSSGKIKRQHCKSLYLQGEYHKNLVI